MPNNLIVFATYWNEIDFIRPSLAQLDRLDPSEIIICDGCFDPSVPNCSTDGTREIIQEFVANRPHARMISALRLGKYEALWKLFRGHSKSSPRFAFTPARVKTMVQATRVVSYRVNQALTFQKMIDLSCCWRPGRWFMTLDCDQFYSDEMIGAFSLMNEETDYGLLLGRENTFFTDFQFCTDSYESRLYNNMPHKIFPGTTIIPTRGAIIEGWSRRSFSPRQAMLNEFYYKKVRTLEVGEYFHYKFKFSNDRLEAGYRLGDRKMPDKNDYRERPFAGRHPEVIEDCFSGRIQGPDRRGI